MATILQVLALAAVTMLLFFGCVSDPKPTEGIQGKLVQNAEGLIGEVQPANTEGPAINCTLAVKQSSIVVGEQVDIALNSSFAGRVRFDIICGEETKYLISENTLTLETNCMFDTPGDYNVTVKANEHECASANVEVRKKANGTCSIDSASIERDLASFYYKWNVNFDGFSDGDVLTWVCDNTVAKKKISSDPVWGMPRFDILSCDFPGKPRGDEINVSIGGVPCGKVSTK